jgi:uncharacterized membrane protein YphA (DoxX/SURF4 family)
MTSLPTLIISFAFIGAILAGLTYRAGRTKHILWTFLQHFCGVWFVFSGLVKAVDPIGTGYKMEDYFASFEDTFGGLDNVFASLAPVFPRLASFSTGFSIFMIVLEIVLGVMLILGSSRKLAAWLFFLVVLFFTFLTGYTYLTGFVPSEVNFFDFAKWGPYVHTQMRVTDCGCFGDFIKLDPRVSFYKDLFLLAPALLFLLASNNMHQLFTLRTRRLIVGLSIAGSLLLCLQNTYWNLPMVDFRPFAIGTNVRERFALEAEARGNVEITGWIMENTNTGEVVTVMNPDYSAVTAQYPKDQGWKYKDRLQSEPFLEKDGKRDYIPITKISDFSITDNEAAREVTEDLLAEPGYSLMIVAYKLKGEARPETVAVQDTVWANDTVRVSQDSFTIRTRMAGVNTSSVEQTAFVPDPNYETLFRTKVNPLAEAAQKAGWKVYALHTVTDRDLAASFRKRIGATYPFYEGDDKLLKTIIRANPGIVVLKDGQVLDMYHHRHLPSFEELKVKSEK